MTVKPICFVIGRMLFSGECFPGFESNTIDSNGSAKSKGVSSIKQSELLAKAPEYGGPSIVR